MKSQLIAVCLIAVTCLLGGGCNYDVPLTAAPTRPIDERLLGDWASMEKGTQKEELMQVRKLDEFTYVVSFDRDIYRAFHSDFDHTAFLSVQDLNSPDRRYLYMTYALEADGRQLRLRVVNTKTIPEKIKDRATLQNLLRQNLKNPDLLGDAIVFSRVPRKR